MDPQAAMPSAPALIIAEPYRQDAHLEELRRELARNEYVKLTGLLLPELSAAIAAEALQLFPLARQRRFMMQGYATPRVLATLGGAKIRQASPLLSSLYDHAELHATLLRITGAPVFPCQHPEEFMVLNYLSGAGATHGWHLDDPAYALVQVIDAPLPEDGGVVELIPSWHEHCRALAAAPDVNVEQTITHARLAALIQRRALASGDTYLMRADRCLHRVSELTTKAARRIVLNLAFEATPAPRYGHTATALYGD